VYRISGSAGYLEIVASEVTFAISLASFCLNHKFCCNFFTTPEANFNTVHSILLPYTVSQKTDLGNFFGVTLPKQAIWIIFGGEDQEAIIY